MKIYAGQTLEGTIIFTGDDGTPIKDFSKLEIKMIIKNKYDDYYILLSKSEMSISAERVTFTITPDKTSKLRMAAVLEIKVTENGKVRIAKEDILEVENNTIKDL